jgi:hypothetical protein
MGHKWLKKKSISLVEKKRTKNGTFFDNHYKSQQSGNGADELSN